MARRDLRPPDAPDEAAGATKQRREGRRHKGRKRQRELEARDKANLSAFPERRRKRRRQVKNEAMTSALPLEAK